ncbi:MAG: hypothetical protein DRP52_04195 [Planctomycetota bacterium]|nr:MAG: hypothetical protein DRP52_04195 [Planctomycetota bacterium]
METKRKAKGSWGVRFFIVVLGIILGFLFYWLLSFVEGDIGKIERPDRHMVRRQYISEELDEQKSDLEKEVRALKRRINTLSEQKRNLGSSTSSLQKTINQLLSIQKESLAKNVEFPEKSVQTLRDSQSAFLENQNKDLEFNQEISVLIQQRQEQESSLTEVAEQIKTLEKDVNADYCGLMKKHRLKVAVLKLSFLVPVFLVVSFFFMKFRSGAYWPLVWSAFIASFIKIALVAHEYFPTNYFKYIALVVIIGIVLRILIYLIRMIVAPKKDLLIKQYQQFYDKHRCPVCTKPIKAGPLRYAGWKKKTTVLAAQGTEIQKQEPYTCPSCGTNLYNKCGSCGNIRHSLLPYCEHCGVEK